MKKATMFAVGMLMIATLVGLGASAEAPDEPGDDWTVETRSKGHFLEDDHSDFNDGPVHCPWETDWLVVGSNGGAHWCCGCCPGCVEPRTYY
jgi:hypothetical protein